MSDHKSASGSIETLKLPAVMDIQASGPLHGLLRGFRGRSVVLEASGVQRVGGQCLQVLLSAVLAWRQDGLDLAVVSPSPAFEDGLSLLGFSSTTLFGKD